MMLANIQIPTTYKMLTPGFLSGSLLLLIVAASGRRNRPRYGCCASVRLSVGLCEFSAQKFEDQAAQEDGRTICRHNAGIGLVFSHG